MLNDAQVSKKYFWQQAIRICAEEWMDWRGSSAFSSNWIRMIKILCSYSAADAVTGSKPYSGKAMVFFLCISAWTAVLFAGRGLRMKRY